MAKTPQMEVVAGATIGNDALLSGVFGKKPITIDYDCWNGNCPKMPRNTLYGRQSASPGKYAPFFLNTAITAIDDSGADSLITVSTDDVVYFKAGDSVTYYDVSEGKLAAETKDIKSVDTTTGVITLNGKFSTPPVANDLLVLADGTELSKDVVLVEEDLDMANLGSDVVTSAIYAGRIDENKINRATYLVKGDVQRLIIEKV